MKNHNDFHTFLNDEVNLNATRIKNLDEKTDTINRLLTDNLVGYRKSERQGSYALGTIIKPVKEEDEFDADLLVFMKEQAEWTAKDYINALLRVFQDNGNYQNIVRRKTRCVTIDYKADFHLDLVPAIEKDGRVFICNCKTDAFEETDGTGFRDWFNEKNRITNGYLKKTTRLFKYLRDRSNNFSVKSILLTTLLGNSVRDDDGFDDTADAFKALFDRLNDLLQANPMVPTINNPVLSWENFNRHWDQLKYSNFRDKVRDYCEKVNAAYYEQDRNESIRKWRKVFGDSFGEIKKVAATQHAPTPPHKPFAH